ncbi:MAG TPA: beta-L-arabinofuranosidase domain-containing protein [Kofleriaceae bacterium]|jgi:hypothetical protein
MARRFAVAAVWLAPSAVLMTLVAHVYGTARIAPPDRLGDAARAAVIAPLRDALENRAPAPCALHAPPAAIAVTVWLDGHSLARVDGHGSDLGGAVDAAARELRALAAVRLRDAATLARARIQVDVIGGRAPLRDGVVQALALPEVADVFAVDPGRDGIGVDLGDGREYVMLPHELVAKHLVAAFKPVRALDDFAIGVDLPAVGALLAERANVRGAFPPDVLFRFRSDAFVEAPRRDAPPLPLERGRPPAPEPTARTLREAALAGGRYLVAHLAANGRFEYEHELATGATTDAAYSLPRHAGTAYFLAELYRITKEPWLREPIERALAEIARLAGGCGGIAQSGARYACVVDRGDATALLGTSALSVMALVEYQRATGDARYLELARALAEHVLMLQRDDGSFRHVFDPRTQLADDHTQLLYSSGEAALALARMYAVTGDARYERAAERALDWLVGWYDFFAGGFFFGEEHWTCLAAEALWPAAPKPAYRTFCADYAAFARRQQQADGEFAGAYGVTPFVAPYDTPAGSYTEAMLSAHAIDPDPRTAAQIRAALGYLLREQLRPDSDFAAVGDVDGGIPASTTERTVRIDYVQHACSAMIRASEVIDSW